MHERYTARKREFLASLLTIRYRHWKEFLIHDIYIILEYILVSRIQHLPWNERTFVFRFRRWTTEYRTQGTRTFYSIHNIFIRYVRQTTNRKSTVGISGLVDLLLPTGTMVVSESIVHVIEWWNDTMVIR